MLDSLRSNLDSANNPSVTAIMWLIVSFSFVAAPALAESGKAPSANEILDRYARSMGGTAAFEEKHSMVLRGSIEFPANKLSGTTAEYFKAPDHFSAVTEVPGYGTVRTVYDGKSGWTVDRKGGVTEFSGAELADVARRADILWHVKLKELYPGIKLKGRVQIEGKDAWVLESIEDGWKFDLYFDVQSGLLVRFDTDTGEPNGTSNVQISDYRSVGNVKFSYGAALIADKVIWRRKLTEVQFNVPIDDALFQRSKGAAAPAPAPLG